MNCEENIEIAWVSNYKEIATAKIRADEWRDDRTKTMEFMTLKDTDGQAVAVVFKCYVDWRYGSVQRLQECQKT